MPVRGIFVYNFHHLVLHKGIARRGIGCHES
jgi:hypothetical protein